MDPEEGTKPCPNCKREIPSSNLHVHELHCARNISACPTCKEPVPRALMQDHHDKLHKLVPCKQCGESVCGTDLEDHIRDSCANTIKSCRFCELELPRRSLPAHESYCGTRTEQCPDCNEYVMIKYRQLHLDSNHGFLRLDDDPVPRKEPKPARVPIISSSPFATATNNRITAGPSTRQVIRYFKKEEPTPTVSSSNENRPSTSRGVQSASNGVIAKNGATEKNEANSPSSGTVKKRRAPPPPREPPAPLEQRDLPYYSALKRSQDENKERQKQNAFNLAHGLPPVLNPAEKLEKLRKMSALANIETQPVDYKDKLRGRVWMPAEASVGNVLGASRMSQVDADLDNNNIENPDVAKRKGKEIRKQNQAAGPAPVKPISPQNQAQNPGGLGNDEQEFERRKREFQNLKPMTPEEFMDRFNKLQMPKRGEQASNNVGEGRVRMENQDGGGEGRRNDRFSQIKTSLRELRRGLNEVTAPYNSNNVNTQNNQSPPPVLAPPPLPFCPAPPAAPARSAPPAPPAAIQPPAPPAAPLLLETRIPCEFCTELIDVDDLVIHQTGCRPDLAQLRPSPLRSPPRSPPPPALPLYDRYEEPVIPCEFCLESLPVYLITEHQERCGREANLLYPD